MKRRYVGIDLGKRSMMVCAMDENQKQLDLHSYGTSESQRKRLFENLSDNDIVGIEAGSLTFRLAKEIINQVGATVHVLHPGKLHFIFKSVKKTDSEDARKIARYLVTNPAEALYTVSLPTDQEIENRAITHELQYLNKTRTRKVNRLHSIFLRQGITNLKRKHLRNETSRGDVIIKLTGYDREEAKRLNKYITMLEEDIALLELKMRTRLSEDSKAQYLLSIPGVAVKTAFAFLSFLGDGSRFSKGREVSNYVGMVPRIDASGDTLHMGSIHKRGPSILRAYYVQAAWALVRSRDGGALKTKYKELISRVGKRKAVVAIARKMMELSWTLITNQEFYSYGSEKGRKRKLKYYGIYLRDGA
jgi:transposase